MRQQGYYWVKWNDEWHLAKWLAGNNWWYMPLIGPVDVRVAKRLTDDLQEINETRIPAPDEDNPQLTLLQNRLARSMDKLTYRITPPIIPEASNIDPTYSTFTNPALGEPYVASEPIEKTPNGYIQISGGDKPLKQTYPPLDYIVDDNEKK